MRKVVQGNGLLTASALCALVLGACHHKPAPAPPPPPQTHAIPLQIVSLSPGTITPGASRTVTVFGSGFVSGTTADFGDVGAEKVVVKSDNELAVTVPPLEVGTYDVGVHNPDKSSDHLRAGLVVQASKGELACQYVVLFFDTDQSGLLPAAKSTLSALVSCYSGTDEPVAISGHADARGTTDYNLSLSLERALAVQTFLLQAGLPKERLPVTSFGEERPAVQGYGEQVWAQNRRVELTVE